MTRKKRVMGNKFNKWMLDNNCSNPEFAKKLAKLLDGHVYDRITIHRWRLPKSNKNKRRPRGAACMKAIRKITGLDPLEVWK